MSFFDSTPPPVVSVGANQTERFSLDDGSGDSSSGSTEAGAAGTVTMSWTLNIGVGDQHWAQVAASLKEAVTSATGVKLIKIKGGVKIK